MPDFLRLDNWIETVDCVRLTCGKISQTHFSPFRRNVTILKRVSSDNAFKIFNDSAI